MKRARILAFAALAAAVAAFGAFPAASAKPAEKAVPPLRCAPTYAAAMAEAKDRGCFVFATFHADG